AASRSVIRPAAPLTRLALATITVAPSRTGSTSGSAVGSVAVGSTGSWTGGSVIGGCVVDVGIVVVAPPSSSPPQAASTSAPAANTAIARPLRAPARRDLSLITLMTLATSPQLDRAPSQAGDNTVRHR